MATKAEIEDRVRRLQTCADNLRDSLKVWEDAGLPRSTLMLLLQHKTKISQRTINTILDGLESLYDDYLVAEED